MEDLCKRIQADIKAHELTGNGTMKRVQNMRDAITALEEAEASIKWIEERRQEAFSRAEAAEDKVKKLKATLLEIRELNMTAEDEEGRKFANSDLIEQAIVFAL